MSVNLGLAGHRLIYEISPIILTNGITADFPVVAALPIMSLTEIINFPFSTLTDSASLSLDNFFAHYQVLSSSTLISQQIGKYPFANSTIAANATIKVPKAVSMAMLCPVQNKLGWLEKKAIIEAMVYTLEKHNSLGGTYIVLTPSYVYWDCVMLGMHDISSQLTKQVQNAWQFDFEQPLLTKTAVDSILSTLSEMITGGQKIPQTANVFGAATSGAPISAAAPVAKLT